MATFVCATYYHLVSLGGNQYQIAGGSAGFEQTCTDNEEGNSFSFGETISISGIEGNYLDTYRGFFDGGFVGEEAGGVFYFYTDDTSIDLGTIFTVNTADFIVCFLKGTSVATPTGETAVEDLAIGDLVSTADGRVAPVRWVGVQSVVTFFADPLHSFPIRIVAGALGEGLPVRDLLVSPDHALMLDGVLVQAGALVNGTTIVRETAMPERFTYFHIELEDHALVLAEGVPAETFVDNVTRRRFDNFAEYEVLYGDAVATISELDLPRVKSARQLPQALRVRLAERAAALLPAASTAA